MHTLNSQLYGNRKATSTRRPSQHSQGRTKQRKSEKNLGLILVNSGSILPNGKSHLRSESPSREFFSLWRKRGYVPTLRHSLKN